MGHKLLVTCGPLTNNHSTLMAQTRQLYASIGATTAGTIYVELPTNARLRGISWTLIPISVADGDYLYAEISTVSTSQVATNDAYGILAVLGGSVDITTSGAAQLGQSGFCPVDCVLRAGDRIYVNATENGNATWSLRALLHFT